MKYTNEQLNKASTAKNAEELLEMARQNGIEMTPEEAAEDFAKLSPPYGELGDDELDNVAGGGCGGNDNAPPAQFSVGQTVVLASCKDSKLILRKFCTVTQMKYKNGEWHYTVNRYGLTEEYRESELCAT